MIDHDLISELIRYICAMSRRHTENHIGQNISRIRELRRIKQSTLATALNMSQQAVSMMEKKANIDDDLLARVAQALEVKPERVRNFDDDLFLNFFNGMGQPQETTDSKIVPFHTIQVLNRLIEALDENKRLYERLLEAEKSKTAWLEKLFANTELLNNGTYFPHKDNESEDMKENIPYLGLQLA